MPQMSPLSWLILMFFFIILMIMMTTLNYFLFFHQITPSLTTKIKNTMFWKW